MTNSYLENLEKQEKRLVFEQKRLAKERYFYQTCLKFSQFDIDQTNQILDRVAKLISVQEGEKYIFYEFSITEKGHYVTRYYSRLEGLPNVSGAELAATSEAYSEWCNPQTYTEKRIVKKSTCETFLKLSFENQYDYFHNLDKILESEKYFVFKGNFGSEDFAEEFPYVKDYLESLVAWRLENHTLEIPEEVMDSLLNIPKYLEEKKLNKIPVSQP